MQLETLVPEYIWTISDFFSPEECKYCIDWSEREGFGDAPISTGAGAILNPEVRNNARVMVDAQGMADDLWNRVSSFAPTPLLERNAIGLNERLRFYRYDVGQTFRSHLDGSFRRGNGERSLVTFMVYLNEDFSGGQTRFDLRRPWGEVEVVPRTGMALLFQHHVRHAGATVLSGRKYVLRSDVMYSAPRYNESDEN